MRTEQFGSESGVKGAKLDIFAADGTFGRYIIAVVGKAIVIG